jgi:hypothetical protein
MVGDGAKMFKMSGANVQSRNFYPDHLSPVVHFGAFDSSSGASNLASCSVRFLEGFTIAPGVYDLRISFEYFD